MKKWLSNCYFRAKERINNFMREESGEASLIAVILIVVVVIALAVLFRDSLTGIVNDLLDGIESDIAGF